MPDSDLLDLAEGIAIAAGKEILDVYGRTGTVDVTVKKDNSPLTEADQRANNLIVNRLMKSTPDIPVLSEESELLDFAERGDWDTYWLVDPLDGTKEFIKRNGEFTVNIALIKAGKPVIGVVHVPVTGVTYKGINGQGAYKQNADEIARPIHCHKIQQNQTGLRVVASRSHRGEQLDALLKLLQQRFTNLELVSMGSSLKICLVAEGMADIYPRLAPTCEWDTAAAHAVLAAAGGSVVDTQFHELHYNTRADLLNPFFIAIADSDYPWHEFLHFD